MLQTLWLLIPQEALPLIFVGIGFLTVFRILSAGQAVGLILMLCLVELCGSLIEGLLDLLPDWAFGLLCLWLIISLIGTIFGRRVMENVLSMIIFSFLAFPFRALARLIRLGRRLP